MRCEAIKLVLGRVDSESDAVERSFFFLNDLNKDPGFEMEIPQRLGFRVGWSAKPPALLLSRMPIPGSPVGEDGSSSPLRLS